MSEMEDATASIPVPGSPTTSNVVPDLVMLMAQLQTLQEEVAHLKKAAAWTGAGSGVSKS